MVSRVSYSSNGKKRKEFVSSKKKKDKNGITCRLKLCTEDNFKVEIILRLPIYVPTIMQCVEEVTVGRAYLFGAPSPPPQTKKIKRTFPSEAITTILKYPFSLSRPASFLNTMSFG